ncbi:MAG: aldehyde dehydrogenase family protein, partial [Candidatus Cybelea sp.]
MQVTANSPADPEAILAHLPHAGGVIPMYVDGQWQPARSGASRELFNPSNGQRIATIAEAEAEDVEAAIVAARNAFDRGPWAS